jgi:hypothetical protein
MKKCLETRSFFMEPRLLNYHSESAYHYGKWAIEKDFKIGREVILGFSRKNGHAFLIAGKYEVHGHMIFKRTWLRSFGPYSCKPLLYFRFTGLTDCEVNDLENYLERVEGIRDITCIDFILNTLENALGIVPNYERRGFQILRHHVPAMLDEGFSAPTEVIKTEEWSRYKIMEHMYKLDNRFESLAYASYILGNLSLLPWRTFKKLASNTHFLRHKIGL